MANVMLLARERGLHTCALESWAEFPKTVREQLHVPESDLVFCGLALGYAVDVPVNHLVSERASLEDFAVLHGAEWPGWRARL
mmetsp:Transcript_17118/g.40843  ORF Transcript_17118/g.40843 Transcript_17118/m.40843 type:complete len:83 (-) Transcript_17118:73-321(-)